MGNFKGLFIAIILGAISYFLGSYFFEPVHGKLLGIIVFLVTLWTNEALPLGAVSLLPIILFPAFDVLSTNAVSANYSKSIIFLFLGGFLLAIAVEKIGLHKVIANKLLSIFPSTPRGVIYSLALTSAIMSAFLSNTTTALLLISIALFLTENAKLRVRFVLAVAYGASIGGIITPIGTPPNLILLGFLESIKIEPVSFIQWSFMTAPLAVTMLIVMGYILSLGASNMTVEDLEKLPPLTQDQKKLLWVLGSLVVTLLVNSPIKPFYDGLGLNEKGILLSYGLLMFMPYFNFLTWEDTKKIPYAIIFLFGAGFSIAAAFMKTGLAGEVAELLSMLSGLNTYLLIIIVATFVTFTTEITSNTALTSMILPVIYTLAQNANISPELFLMVATICASYAFMLPISTPPNAIAMSSGVIKIKDMATRGFLFNVLGIIFITLFGIFYWGMFLN